MNKHDLFLPMTDSSYLRQNSSDRPKQGINDLQILSDISNFSGRVLAYSIRNLLYKFGSEQNLFINRGNINNRVNFIQAENKGLERINEKIKEENVGDFDKILDYTRCSISFPTLETLFDFVNYAKSFDFETVDYSKFNEILKKSPRIIDYVANNFNLNKNTVTKEKLEKYPFLNRQVLLKDSEFMDIKLYLKVPIELNGYDNIYVLSEVLCTLHGFINYYEITHIIYEITRSDKNYIQKNEQIQKFIQCLAYKLHRDQVINKYNDKVNGSEHFKIIDTNEKQEQNYLELFNLIDKEIMTEIEKDLSYNILEHNKNSKRKDIKLLDKISILSNYLDKSRG